MLTHNSKLRATTTCLMQDSNSSSRCKPNKLLISRTKEAISFLRSAKEAPKATISLSTQRRR